MSSFERRGFADQLSIETPEQVTLEFPVAGVGSRFVALLLDHLIQFGVFLALGLLVVVVLAMVHRPGLREASSTATKWFLAGLIFVAFVLFWGYFSLFEAFWHGQTPGKRVMKLRVIKDSGRQITLFEALARNLLRYVDYMPSLYLAGVVTMLVNQRNKRLGDLAAGTMVVHERQETQPLLWTGVSGRSSAFAAPPATSQEVFPADAVARLSGEDLAMIEAFFGRALDLPLETRATMAGRILAELTGRMRVSIPAGNPERALEALATALRAYARPYGR